MSATDSPSSPRAAITEDSFPVSLILARDEVQVGRWRAPSWRVLGVLAGAPSGVEDAADTSTHRGEAPGDAPAASPSCRHVLSEEGQPAYLWSGFTLRLYRDSTESYWHNLLGRQPSLFIICRTDEETGEFEPCAVSANYDEAGAYMEADDTVLSAPIPPEIYRWIEEYVVKYFRPVERKVRKRRDWWLEEKDHDAGPKVGRSS